MQLSGKRILLVDDDPLVRRVYQDGLARRGFRVETAEDGLTAMKALRANPPDLMVLDLMMPKLNGPDVLKFLRSEPSLKHVPVIVLSNSYMNELTALAAAAEPQRLLLKVRSTPASLAEEVVGVLEGRPAATDHSMLLAAPAPPPAAPAPKRPPPPSAPAAPPAPLSEHEFRQQARRDFLGNAAVICGDLRNLHRTFAASRNDPERELRLQSLYRKVHFICATAGLSECHEIAQMATVLEALLFGLAGKPELVTPSIAKTISQAVEFLVSLFERASSAPAPLKPAMRVLAVDDNPMSSRLVVSALRQVEVQARSVVDAVTALQLAREETYDLLLLDIEMPGLDGFELCRQVRALPGYGSTPVIFVTSHTDFDSRSRTVLSGGNDLIAKPFFPLELAVKVMIHILRRP